MVAAALSRAAAVVGAGAPSVVRPALDSLEGWVLAPLSAPSGVLATLPSGSGGASAVCAAAKVLVVELTAESLCPAAGSHGASLSMRRALPLRHCLLLRLIH